MYILGELIKMGKETQYEQSETGNWNAAKEYSETKIMKWLLLADRYEWISEFGAEDLFDELTANPQDIILMRLKAIQRLAKALELICDNSTFAIKNPADKKLMKDYGKEIKKIRGILKNVHKVERDRDRKKIVLDEKLFNDCLSYLMGIKKDVLDPMNRADLIFVYKETFDPKKFKENLKEDLSELG